MLMEMVSLAVCSLKHKNGVLQTYVSALHFVVKWKLKCVVPLCGAMYWSIVILASYSVYIYKVLQ